MTKRKSKIILFILILLISTNNTTVFGNGFPGISAQSYIVIDQESGRVIASKNPNKKMPMASTTKIITAIVALDKSEDLKKIITIPEYCTCIEGSSLYLKPNQRVELIDLLYGLMLRSGNDAALAIADYFSNKNSNLFVSDMNKFALKIGAVNTNFVNPHGLHDTDHYTTAYDLAIITKYALNNETFRKIVASKKWVPNSLDYTLYNKNKVVLNYKYGTGVKIGYTKKSGRCISASAKKDDAEIIVVLLNAPNWFNDCYKIFDWAFSNYKKYNIIQDRQYVLNENVTSSAVLLEGEFNYLLKPDELNRINIEFNKFPFIINGSNNKYYGYYKIILDNKVLHIGNLLYEK